jgi:hypothetical protein
MDDSPTDHSGLTSGPLQDSSILKALNAINLGHSIKFIKRALFDQPPIKATDHPALRSKLFSKFPHSPEIIESRRSLDENFDHEHFLNQISIINITHF